jgi:NAD(P)-dependent dehydrogenase (short-subunit alcohol dehydrogenase family)
MATQGLHVEYADQGIRCFGFQPGIVDTDMQAELQNSGLPPELLPPLDIMVQPEEVARAVAWLCGSDSNAFVGREFSIYDPDFRKAAGL